MPREANPSSMEGRRWPQALAIVVLSILMLLTAWLVIRLA
jgi:hypothetical protein